MRTLSLMTALAIAIFGTSAVAAAQKPVGLFGIELGSRLDLPVCPENAFDAPDSAYKSGLCLKDADSKDAPAAHHVEVVFADSAVPDYRASVIGMSLDITVVDGRVEDVFYYTNGVEGQQEVFNLLKRKFGRPYRSGIKVMANLMGARFKTIQAVWAIGTDIVSFRGARDDLDTGSIEVMTLSESKRQDEERMAASQKKPHL